MSTSLIRLSENIPTTNILQQLPLVYYIMDRFWNLTYKTYWQNALPVVFVSKFGEHLTGLKFIQGSTVLIHDHTLIVDILSMTSVILASTTQCVDCVKNVLRYAIGLLDHCFIFIIKVPNINHFIQARWSAISSVQPGP